MQSGDPAAAIRRPILDASTVALCDLRKIIADIDSAKVMVTELQEKATMQRHSIPVVNTLKPPPSGKSAMLGFDEKLIEIKDRLTGDQRARQVIPIIGMGGIGKTTLAKIVYDDPLIVEYFHLRIWVTVSQGYSVKELLLQTLNEKGDSGSSESEDKLGEKLYKSLFGRKYLLVLDDVWRLEDWEKIRYFFPDNSNKSRIVITSRLSNLGASFSSFAINMDFLDEHKSWHLFCEKAFGSQCYPPELEKVGKEIVKKCKGLPLSIVVIGGLLAKSCRTQEYWKDVAKDVNSILSSENDNQCLSILSLSYSHLPIHLKPCFLYMGMFREDDVIFVSKLKKFWVAEGFLKPYKSKTFEEVAMIYLKDLIDRNLILVSGFGRSGNIKTCYIHDLVRDMCLDIAHKEKFFCSINFRNTDMLQDIKGERRIVMDASHWDNSVKNIQTMFDVVKLASLARSLFYISPRRGLQQLVNSELLRIWDQSSSSFSCQDTEVDEIFHFNINIRYLHFPFIFFQEYGPFIPSIYHLWNLQTIVLSGSPSKLHALAPIWQMLQLRHIDIRRLNLPNPSSNQVDEFVMENLQTLEVVQDFKCTEQVLNRIPNIRKLKIEYDDCQMHSLDYCLNNIGRFQKLESFSCMFKSTPCYSDLVPKLTLPSSLKKLTLEGSGLDWNDLTVIGCLPYLEVLKLCKKSVVGHEWNVIAGGFQSLRYLHISGCSDLTYWVVDSSQCFPVLETVYLAHLHKLSEIPSGIAETPTLTLIKVFLCSESIATSAVNISEEQFSMGNEDLQVGVAFVCKEEQMSFSEKVDAEHLESYARKKLQILGPREYKGSAWNAPIPTIRQGR